jgi:hypothetical protein
MPRCPRAALDYFPVDTSWNLKMKLLIARFGLDGLGAVIQLEQMVFREGYFCRWSKDAESLFIMENSTTKERLREILDYCLDNGIFDRTIFARKGILTSRDIQLQWLKICELSRRKSYSIALELDLTPKQYEFDDLQNINLTATESDLISQKLSENNGNSPEKSIENIQSLSKEKEIKEKESPEDSNDYTNETGNNSVLLKRLFNEIEMRKKKKSQ